MHPASNAARTALLLAALLFSAPAPAQQESLFDALAGPGEKVSLTTGDQKDGSRGVQDTVTNKGEIISFTAKGRTVLRSPKLNLDTDSLFYDHKARIIRAEGDVKVDQGGVQAACQLLVYTLETGELVLTGAPVVSQQAETGNSRFEGMAEFALKRLESGRTEIRMTGGEEILCEMLPATKPEATPTPAAEPTPAPAGAGAPGSGFAGLGNNVRIRTRPRPDAQPMVMASIGAANEFEHFEALGSVLVESDDMRLRSDELEYNAIERRIDARRNVYIKQENIEADCQAMMYEIDRGRIELTGKPEIRDVRPTGMYKISNLAAYIITRSADGSIATQSIAGPDGPSSTEFISSVAATPVAATPAPTDDGEIRLDREEDLEKIGPKRP